jgi:hypothetical protein
MDALFHDAPVNVPLKGIPLVCVKGVVGQFFLPLLYLGDCVILLPATRAAAVTVERFQ